MDSVGYHGDESMLPGADVLEHELARRIPHVDDAARNGRYRLAGGSQVRIQIEVMVSSQRRQVAGRNDRYARYRQPHAATREQETKSVSVFFLETVRHHEVAERQGRYQVTTMIVQPGSGSLRISQTKWLLFFSR